MKKFALLLAVALPMVFTSCGDDNEPADLVISDNTLNVNWNTTVTLTSSEEGTTWLTDNEFVASVAADGKVTANHVGTCTITASWNGQTAQCAITVLPTNNDFVMPCITWGADAAAVKAAVKGFWYDEANSTDTDLRYYTDNSYAFPAYQYLLNDGGLYSSSLLLAPTVDAEGYFTEASKCDAWLAQYYADVTTDDDEDTIYANAANIADATQTVTLTLLFDANEDPMAVQAIWTAPATKGTDVVAEAKAAARKMLKK